MFAIFYNYNYNYNYKMIKYCKISNCRFPISHVSSGHLCGNINCREFGHGILECSNSLMINNLKQKYQYDTLGLNIQCTFGGCTTKQFHTSDSHHCMKCYDRLHSIETCPTNINNQYRHSYIVNCPICRTKNYIKSNTELDNQTSDECIICMNNKINILLPNCGHKCICNECMIKLNKNTLLNQYDSSINIFDRIRDEKTLESQSYNIQLLKSLLKEHPSYIILYEGMGCSTYIRRYNQNEQLEGLFQHADDGYNNDKIKLLDDFILGYEFIQMQ